jgi:hypothetical protein
MYAGVPAAPLALHLNRQETPLSLNTSTRTGFAAIQIFGLLFTASNFHAPRHHRPWLTGVFADFGPWKRKGNRYRAWFIELAVLGFCVGVCR